MSIVTINGCRRLMNDRIIREKMNTMKSKGTSTENKLGLFIESYYSQLLVGIRVLIWKMGMASTPKEADDLSQEILSETILTAIEIENRYDKDKSMRAWLLSIAANKIRELRTKETRHGKRMGSVTETYINSSKRTTSLQKQYKDIEGITEDEMIDHLNSYNSLQSHARKRLHLSFDELISFVDTNDQEILRLAFENNLKGKDLAATLRISSGAANVRLSRAVSRLKQAYLASENSKRIKK